MQHFSSEHFRDQRAPRGLGWRQRAAIFGRCFEAMAGPAQGLQTVDIPGILSRLALHRHDVIALKAARPAALDTAPAVALKDKASDGGPAVGAQV